MDDIINILMVEAEDSILQDIVMFLIEKTQCRIKDISLKDNSINILTFPNLEIHINEQAVYYNGIPVPLTHHEFFTLLYLAQHPFWVLSQSMIYEAVWQAPPEHCGSAVTNVISQLRRKIGDGYIETVVGSGYRFVG